MSFILDALKKADEARHPATPSSAGKFRVPRLAPHTPRWPWMLAGIALLAVNAGLIGYIAWPRVVRMAAPAPHPGAVRPESARPRDLNATMEPQRSSPSHAAGAPATVASPARATTKAPADSGNPVERLPATTGRPAGGEQLAAAGEKSSTAVGPVIPGERSAIPERPDRRSALAPIAPSASLVPQTRPSPAALSRGAPRTPPTATVAPQPGPATAPLQPPPIAPAAPDAAKPAATERGRIVPDAGEPAAAPVGPSGRDAARPAAAPAGPPAASSGAEGELSKLKLTVHVWAERPAERLVFINGRKYVQGDRIEDKVVLEEITQDGALVSYQGRRSLIRP